jgi:hypothetical protein
MSLLRAMAQEMSLAVESQFLRSRELTMLFRLQQANRLSKLQNELAAVLGHTVEALGADGCVLFLTETESIDLQGRVEQGKLLGEDLELVRGLAASTQRSDSPLIIGDLEQAENPSVPANSEMEGKLGTIGSVCVSEDGLDDLAEPWQLTSDKKMPTNQSAINNRRITGSLLPSN